MSDDNETTFDAEQFKHPLVRAIENPSPEAFDNLSKAEMVYAVCHYAGIETPEGHPDDHTGTFSKDKVRALLGAVSGVDSEESEESEDDE